jgi:hypothetical protein
MTIQLGLNHVYCFQQNCHWTVPCKVRKPICVPPHDLVFNIELFGKMNNILFLSNSGCGRF